ncbi:MAG: hypothetical protein ACR2OW_02995, partial [Methyloligellaceae bacterium]
RRKKAPKSDTSKETSAEAESDRNLSDVDQAPEVSGSETKQQTDETRGSEGNESVAKTQDPPIIAETVDGTAEKETRVDIAETKPAVAVTDIAQDSTRDTELKSDGEASKITANETDLQEIADTDEPMVKEEDEFELIWRPVRRKPMRPKRTGTGHTAQSQHRKSKNAPPRKQKSKQTKPRKAEKKVKPFDPNSPFAALKKLKDDLESQNSDRQ